MIRETYKGRQLKVVKGRGADYGYTRVTLNGTDMGKHLGNEEAALNWLRGTIDFADETGMGNGRHGAEWFAPGTFELNEHGHVVAPGGTCSCDYCEKRRVQPCANITAGGVCVCDHCMKPYPARTPEGTTMAPKPITEDGPHRLKDREPLGTRYADENDSYTLVAYSVDPVSLHAVPLLIADRDVTGEPSTHWMDRATDGSIPLQEPSDVVGIGSPELHPAEPDPARAQAAREALAHRTPPTFQDTLMFSRVMLTTDLDSADAEAEFLASAKAELQRRRDQWLQQRRELRTDAP